MVKSYPVLVAPRTAACQALLSTWFSKQEYWSGWPFTSPGDRPDLKIKPKSPALQADSLLTELREKPPYLHSISQIIFGRFPRLSVQNTRENLLNRGRKNLKVQLTVFLSQICFQCSKVMTLGNVHWVFLHLTPSQNLSILFHYIFKPSIYRSHHYPWTVLS